MGHFQEVCQYGHIHAQCRCPDPSKEIREVLCNMWATHTPNPPIDLVRPEIEKPVTWDEKYCGRCGGRNPTWSADSPLWNYVMRGDNPNNAEPFDGIICPICFTQLAELAGVRDGRNAIWRLTPDYAYITVELTMTRRSDGAVWNYDTNLWNSKE